MGEKGFMKQQSADKSPKDHQNGDDTAAVEQANDAHARLKELVRIRTIAALNSVKETGEKVVREKLNEVLQIEASSIPRLERTQIAEELYNDIMGYGPLEELLFDPKVTEIMINGYRQVFIERKGRLHQADVRFRDQEHLLNIIDRIVSSIGRHVDEASPMVDARLKDGSRVNVIIPPLSLVGPVMTIRKFSKTIGIYN